MNHMQFRHISKLLTFPVSAINILTHKLTEPVELRRHGVLVKVCGGGKPGGGGGYCVFTHFTL